MILLQSPRIFWQFKAVITREFEVLNIKKYLCQRIVSSVKKRRDKYFGLGGWRFEYSKLMIN